jgi:hypothetical protein
LPGAFLKLFSGTRITPTSPGADPGLKRQTAVHLKPSFRRTPESRLCHPYEQTFRIVPLPTRDATITLLQFEKWGLAFRSLAIFKDQEQINRKVLARYSDVSEKQFSSLGANRERIKKYLEEALSRSD